MGHHSAKNRWATSARFLRQFRREEDGSMVYFGITIFLIILMMGGIGVDVMLAEMRRTQLQDTLDRAVLAASSLEQQLDPQSVVEDYFEKSDLAEHLKDIEVVEGLGFRTVRASADTTVATQFMHLSGVDSLTMNAESAAEERIGSVEISMVLDVSGSMNSNSRLTNLKVAAKDFVDTLSNTTEDGKLSISIVPYAEQVSIPPALADQLTLSDEHNYSNCVNFEANDFATTAIDPNTELKRTMHFNRSNSQHTRGNSTPTIVGSSVCRPTSQTHREVMVLKKDKTVLKNHIDGLQAGGWTSIDLGMKWGTALLDPSMQAPVNTMADNGFIDTAFKGRPHVFNSSETLKVAVLMTDGENTQQGYIFDDYRSGDSNIWWNEQEKKYSVYIGQDTGDEDNDGDTSEPMYYWPHQNAWRDHAYGEGTYDETQTTYECRSYRRNGKCKRYRKIQKTVTVTEPGTAEVLTYPELWAFSSLKHNASSNYAPWMGSSQANNEWFYGVHSYLYTSTKNARTQAICDAAKAEGIVVFTIGFEAPSGGQTVLKNCASSASHYFDVDGLEISDAFAAIAASIRQLRLTQ